MSVENLKDDIKNHKYRRLYLFYGPEEYLKKYYLESIEKELLREDLAALNRIVLEGKPDVRKVVEACETLPMFSEKKLVIIKNSGLLKAGKKAGEEKGKNKGQSDELLTYLQNIPDYTCLVFYEAEVDKRMKLVDTIKKNGLVVEFAYQKPVELVKWVTKVFKSHQKEIDQADASKLVENSEQGMTEILNEVNKLILYLGDRKRVAGEDIEKVCTKSIKGRIFDLTDAIAEKNRGKALKLLEDMVVLKEPIPKILFMITRQFRQVLEIKLLKESGMSGDKAASEMGITPYMAGKLIKQSGSFSVEKLKNAIHESLELDRAIKTGKIKDRIAAEILIVKYSST
ncbi:MAG: DNA polymerase III subunit delta [Clostridia bacterium]|nr:DNA polymerase III subunit delta [Clostridia bacterium]